jgi:hypothetical protein
LQVLHVLVGQLFGPGDNLLPLDFLQGPLDPFLGPRSKHRCHVLDKATRELRRIEREVVRRLLMKLGKRFVQQTAATLEVALQSRLGGRLELEHMLPQELEWTRRIRLELTRAPQMQRTKPLRKIGQEVRIAEDPLMDMEAFEAAPPCHRFQACEHRRSGPNLSRVRRQTRQELTRASQSSPCGLPSQAAPRAQLKPQSVYRVGNRSGRRTGGTLFDREVVAFDLSAHTSHQIIEVRARGSGQPFGVEGSVAEVQRFARARHHLIEQQHFFAASTRSSFPVCAR